MRIRFLLLLYLLTCGLPMLVTMGAERHTPSKPSNTRRDKHRPATKKAVKATKRPAKGVRPKQDRKAKRQKIVVRRRVIKIVSKKGKTANRIPTKRLTRSRSLRGTVYYLASGHGGPDPGAIGRYGRFRLAEDEYAYDVTMRLSQLLKQQGATVYMMVRDPNDGVRNDAVLKLDNDEVSYSGQRIPLNQLARLNQTTSAVNRLYAKHKGAYQRLVTIHVDSRSRGEMIDVFFYHHENSAVGKRLANRIHKRFLANYRRYRPSRPYVGNVSTRSELYVVRKSLAPTVFIELGNIQNRQDQKRFLLASNRQALASWLAEGLMDDYRDQ
ncbi:N-acetylmuramoyl-L-alanine amidase [uncultured Spirosoma sp.]|uniref:N-acetylmuramoyl-L-alanine amidase family protein n=1 Tax=uncultured Spirosoma sp. TaxID=278208 RepID=UPI00258AA0D3|nr:N-acetylmuramoyl-L-alanine amidase [uncultured Spirosoma sp.]